MLLSVFSKPCYTDSAVYHSSPQQDTFVTLGSASMEWYTTVVWQQKKVAAGGNKMSEIMSNILDVWLGWVE